jgi:hypothetical protein
MGRSLLQADPATQPADGTFDHPRSKRRYEVTRKDGSLWHRELLLREGQAEVLLAEYPVKYVIGSGNHAYTYVVEDDGFLLESPISWYASRKTWQLSPGYDDPRQSGFARPIREECLFCHAGRAEAVDRSTHRIRVLEAAIGCERCHGPGSLHIEHQTPRQRDNAAPAEPMDYTIVNPSRLSRDLAEAICQQCHLESEAVVAARGRRWSDFRPGLRLQDFRQVYVFDGTDELMTVTGHVEQMHQSRCYKASDTFSCLSCHDPHGEPAPAERVAYYQAACLNCHRVQSCTVSAALRNKESPANDCVHCHMPRAPTEVPHVAFTHHKVGIHDKARAGDHDGTAHPAAIRPFLPLDRLNEVDRKLSLGQAYRLLSIRDRDSGRRVEYRQRALAMLRGVEAVGLREANLDAALAQLEFEMNVGEPLIHVERALAHPDLTGQSRCDVLQAKAHLLAARGDYAEAMAPLRELTQLRRHVYDWLYLASYARKLGDEPAAIEALTAAVRINPRQWDAHRYLADYYRQHGDAASAAWHDQRAAP